MYRIGTKKSQISLRFLHRHDGVCGYVYKIKYLKRVHSECFFSSESGYEGFNMSFGVFQLRIKKSRSPH